MTRSGRRIATIAPAPRANMRALREVFDEWRAEEILDDPFEENITEALSFASADEDRDPWSD